MQLIKTTDYDCFVPIMSNRELDKRHVMNLQRSIKQRNLLMVRPIIVNENMEVIDGQHRLAAAQMIDEPVYYLQVKGLTQQDLAVLNTHQKNWSVMDFVNFYTLQGVPEYKKLSRLCNKYPLMKPTVMLRMVGYGNKVREGKINISNLPKAEIICDTVYKLLNRGFLFVLERDFCIALHESTPISQAMADKLVARATRDNLYKCLNKQDYKRLIRNLTA